MYDTIECDILVHTIRKAQNKRKTFPLPLINFVEKFLFFCAFSYFKQKLCRSIWHLNVTWAELEISCLLFRLALFEFSIEFGFVSLIIP